MAKDVKLKDIAERSGVSIATVSMVLSGKGKISSEVSDRIIAIADKLEYKRPGAGGDRRLAFRYVTILHTESYRYSWNFSYDLITELENLLIEKGYYPLVIHMNERWQVATIIDEIRANRSGAIFSIDSSDEKVLPRLEELGIPLIVINDAQFQNRCSSVLADDTDGAYTGTKLLIANGHKNILFAEYERPGMPIVVHERHFGYRKAMDESNLAATDDLRIMTILEDQGELERRIGELFKRRHRPTAIFTHDDYYGACVISALHKIGLGVPYDVSIIAPGDVLDYSQPFLPRISTMRIDIELMARMAVELMMTSIVRKEKQALVIKTKLHFVDRGSIRKLR